MTHEAQVEQLRNATNEFIDAYGIQFVKDVEEGAGELLNWLSFLNSYKRTGVADELLDAVACAIRETAACVALGLVRPALFSMRTQIDLVLAWLYFKDHPVEWRLVNRTGDGFKLKKELVDYLSNTTDGFGLRYGILKQTSTRKELDTYRLLSAHIHGQSSPVLPAMHDLSDVVHAEGICKEVTVLARELTEYVGDVLYAVYAPEFSSIPPSIVTEINTRFISNDQKKDFYKSICLQP